VSCWDGISEFPTPSAGLIYNRNPVTHFDNYILQQQSALFLVKTASFFAVGGLIFRAFNGMISAVVNGSDGTVTPESEEKDPDFEKGVPMPAPENTSNNNTGNTEDNHTNTTSVKAKTKKKKRDYNQYRPKFAWLPLEVVKQTFECTTQLAMESLLQIPFRKHHKTRTPQLNVPRLAEVFATNTIFSSETGLGGITCAQLFVGTKSKLTKVFGMHT